MKVSMKRRRRLFDDAFEIDEAVLRYERFDGSMSDPVRRLSFERGDSAAAILFDRGRQTVLMVEQFRYPAWSRDPARGWLVEAVAGTVEPGESPEVAIRREIEEEAGYRLDALTHLSTFFTSPGGSSERIFLYVAFVDDACRVSTGGGADAEDEDTRVVEIPIAEVRERLGSGEFIDAKTVIGLQWLAEHHGETGG